MRETDADVVPLKHVQVREHVRGLIRDAAPGTPAPSERELVQQFGVARMTVRQALEALVSEGLLERIPGRGTFVAEPPRRPQRLTGFSEEMARRGLEPDSETLLARREVAGPGVARALGVESGDPIVRWRRLRRADGRALCLEEVYLVESTVPGLLEGSMPTSLYDELDRRGLRPEWADDSVQADGATEDEGRYLQVDKGSPVLRVQRRAWREDRVVVVSRSTFRGDRFTLYVQAGRTAR